MSANNFIKIWLDKPSGVWQVDECDAEEGIFMVRIGGALSLEEAVEHANRYSKENEIEYGLHIVK